MRRIKKKKIIYIYIYIMNILLNIWQNNIKCYLNVSSFYKIKTKSISDVLVPCILVFGIMEMQGLVGNPNPHSYLTFECSVFGILKWIWGSAIRWSWCSRMNVRFEARTLKNVSTVSNNFEFRITVNLNTPEVVMIIATSKVFDHRVSRLTLQNCFLINVESRQTLDALRTLKHVSEFSWVFFISRSHLI